jgi:hypothetical protein
MLSKYSVLALIGAANAAAGPLPKGNTNYPKFSDTAALVAGDKDTTGVKPAYNQSGSTSSGIIKGFRNNLHALPTQKLAKTSAGNFAGAYASGSEQVILAAQDASVASFYISDPTKAGTNAIVKPTTIADVAAYDT